jgi:Domain of Unknown Function (DUF326)
MVPIKYQICIDACADCIVACKDASNEDLKEEDIQMMSRSIKLDHDCAAICILAMQSMASDSEFVKQICTLCIEICNTCADECDKYAHMEHCRVCSDACRKFAIECAKI